MSTNSGSKPRLQRQIEVIEQKVNSLDRYYRVTVPNNVRFVGTVNIDHTTQGFSDKVIDRLDVIQFEAADLTVILPERRNIIPIGLSARQFSDFCHQADSSIMWRRSN